MERLEGAADWGQACPGASAAVQLAADFWFRILQRPCSPPCAPITVVRYVADLYREILDGSTTQHFSSEDQVVPCTIEASWESP